MIRFYLDDKAPGEESVYSIDWTKYLGQDTLDTNVAPVPELLEGTVVVNTLSNKDATTTNFWVRGGIRGEVSKALIGVQTTAGQELSAEIIIGVR